jgi:hypothetical protein
MEFRVGQRAYCIRNGWGKITDKDAKEIKFLSDKHPGLPAYYKPCGRWSPNDEHPSLYHGVPKIVAPPPPLPDIEVDAPVWVRHSDGQSWLPMHFCRWDREQMIVWLFGGTSHSCDPDDTACYKYWTLEEPNKKEG